MKLYQFAAGMLVLFLICITPGFAHAEEETGFVSIFNGTDLSGWDGRPDAWRVEDGAITSDCDEANPCADTHYIFWTVDEPGDFILRLRYRLVGGNSGIQFRSERRGDYDVWGYQADFEDATQWNGCLFQHDRGGVVMRGYRALLNEDGSREEVQFADPDALQAVVKEQEWNEYEITAIGQYIQLKINDVLMCEVIDRDETMSREKGVIALQMHVGTPMKVQFKDIRIKILD